MIRVTYVEANDTEHVVKVASGTNAMEAAVSNGVPGIDGDCGGQAACATCHVYVDPAWTERTGPANPDPEWEMLQFSNIAQPNSRLACQIILDERLDGLILRMPEGQF